MPIQPKTWRVCDPWEQVLNAKDIETDDGVFQEDMQIICLLSHQARNRIKTKSGWKGPMCDTSVAEYNEHLHHPAAEWLEHIRFNRIKLRLASLSFMKAAVNILHGALYLFRYVRLGYKKLKPICGTCHYSARYSLTELPRPMGIRTGNSIWLAFNVRNHAHNHAINQGTMFK